MVQGRCHLRSGSLMRGPDAGRGTDAGLARARDVQGRLLRGLGTSFRGSLGTTTTSMSLLNSATPVVVLP